MEQNRVIVMTESDLKEFAAKLLGVDVADNRQSRDQVSPDKYVYGLRGIRELFNVSHATAQRYKNTFLAPAVSQRGRKIIVNRDLAIQLYNNSMK